MKSPLQDDTLEEALANAKQLSRRRWLRGGAISLGVVAIGGVSAFAYSLKRGASDRDESVLRAREAEASLRAGKLPQALKLADEARELDGSGAEGALAWIHARAVDVIDGNGTSADAVHLLHSTRLLGAGDTDFAIAALASAVGMRNDKLAGALLKQHEQQGIAGSALYAFVRGAAFDLTCNLGAAVLAYEQAVGDNEEIAFARVRHARALLLSGRFEEAQASIAKLAPASLEARVLVAALAALSATPTNAEPLVLADLPRSLRPLSAACSLVDPSSAAGQSMGLDAALDDVDSALVATACASVALKKGDRAAAKTACDRALAMQPDLEEARHLGARLALDDGDVDSAKNIAGASFFDIAWVTAYEADDATQLAALLVDMSPKEANRDAATLAREVLALSTPRDTDPVAMSERQEKIDALTKRAEKARTDGLAWSSFIAFDIAMLAASTRGAAKAIASKWPTEKPPEAIRRRKAKLTP